MFNQIFFIWFFFFLTEQDTNLSTCVHAWFPRDQCGEQCWDPQSFFLPLRGFFFFFLWEFLFFLRILEFFRSFFYRTLYANFFSNDLSDLLLPEQLSAHPTQEWVCMGVSIVIWAASKGSEDCVRSDTRDPLICPLSAGSGRGKKKCWKEQSFIEEGFLEMGRES